MAKLVSAMPQWRFDAAKVEIPAQWDVSFVNPANAADLIAACQQAACLLVPASFPVINADTLQHISQLKLIQTVGAGYDLIDVTAAAGLGVPVANVPGANANSVAEFTVGVIIALQRQLLVTDRETKAGQYSTVRQAVFRAGLKEIAGSVIGLVGLGAIGRQTARILRLLGATVYYYSRSGQSRELEAELGIAYKPLAALLSQSDIVSVHVPLTEETRHMLGRYELGLLPPDSLLINTARGEVVDQQALAEMLAKGNIAGAAIDVVAPEPPPATHPLLNLPPAARDRLLITPHIAGVTLGSFRNMLTLALDNIDRVLHGEWPRNVVNGVVPPDSSNSPSDRKG